MNLLALDTSTEWMSIAVQRRGVAQPWCVSGVGGARSSTHLIPDILRLLAQADLTLAQLDAIAFGAGPGAFTGLRSACAVVQGLAFGAKLPVLPVDTLLTVAEDARARLGGNAHLRVTALLDARMDELYTADYEFDSFKWKQIKGVRLIKPEELTSDTGCVLAGNAFEVYAGRLPATAGGVRVPALPSATAMLRLSPGLIDAGHAVSATQALPIYIRDKVAQTTQERLAVKASAAVQAP